MNPFKSKTISHQDFEVLSDLKWHCAKCGLNSSQAKTWQIWRQKGIQLDTDEEGKFYKKVFCKKCNNKTMKIKIFGSLARNKIKIRLKMDLYIIIIVVAVVAVDNILPMKTGKRLMLLEDKLVFG